MSLDLTPTHVAPLTPGAAFTRMAGVAAAALLAAFASGSAKAQDFDCRTATLAAEKTICAQPQLSRLDDRTAMLYGKLWSKLDDGNREGLRDYQLAFLATRNACGRDGKCIADAYRDQIGVLRQRLAANGGGGVER